MPLEICKNQHSFQEEDGYLICTKCGFCEIRSTSNSVNSSSLETARNTEDDSSSDNGYSLDDGSHDKSNPFRTYGGPTYDPKFQKLSGTQIGSSGNVKSKNHAQNLDKITKQLKKADKIKEKNSQESDTTHTSAIQNIKNLCDVLSLSNSIQDNSIILFNKLRSDGVNKRIDTIAFSSCCLYFSAEEHNVKKKFDDFIKFSNSDKKLMYKIKKIIQEHTGKQLILVNPLDHLPSLKNDFPLSLKEEKSSREILKKYPNTAGKKSIVLMLCAIYLAIPDERKKEFQTIFIENKLISKSGLIKTSSDMTNFI